MSAFKSSWRLYCFFMLAATIAVQTATGAIIFNNGAPNNQQGGGYFSDFDVSLQVADSFTLLPAGTVLTGVNWWGGYFGAGQPGVPAVDNFTIRVFADVGGAGGPALNPVATFVVGNVVNRTATGDTFKNFSPTADTHVPEFSYSAAIPSLALAANTRYWLSIVNNTSGDSGSNELTWVWETSDAIFNDDTTSRTADGGAWSPIAGAPFGVMAFNLTGPDAATVPEPTSLVLLGGALVIMSGAGVARRRQMTGGSNSPLSTFESVPPAKNS